MTKDPKIAILEMIIEDAKQDINEAEGQAFTGHNVSAFWGKQNAMIEALAKILKEMIVQGCSREIKLEKEL